MNLLIAALLGIAIYFLSVKKLKVNSVLAFVIAVLLTFGITVLLTHYFIVSKEVESILIVLLCIAFLVLLIAQFKINAFLVFLIISIFAGLLLGLDTTKIITSVQKGIGDMLGALVVTIIAGAMLGKLVAESGAAQQISSSMMKIFGEKYIHWALMVTGFIIGIPLFYNVGFVLVVPLIFSVAYQYKLPTVTIAIPILASLSVTHGFLPPHPSPTALVIQLHADMGRTFFYGLLVVVPTVILAGPLFSKTIKNINPPIPKTFSNLSIAETQLPSLTNSILSALTPVVLLAVSSIIKPMITGDGWLKQTITFLNEPVVVMLLSLLIVTYSIGIHLKIPMKKIMDIYADSVKDIAMLLLIMGGAGALKQILVDSGVSNEIAKTLIGLHTHPLILGWSIACVLRLCIGSATVAGVAAAGIISPLMTQLKVDASLMVIAIGSGSLMFSHVNDSGFWLFKEYFNLTIKETIKTWSVMESIVSFCGLAAVLLIDMLG